MSRPTCGICNAAYDLTPKRHVKMELVDGRLGDFLLKVCGSCFVASDDVRYLLIQAADDWADQVFKLKPEEK